MGYLYLEGQHETASCPKCKVTHTLPKSLYDAAMARAGSLAVYCPHGHSWVFTPKDELAREEALRQERDRLKQQLAWKDDVIQHERDGREHERRQRIALKGQLTKTKKRVAAGVCPCCNRTFQNLADHMASQHKDFAQDEPEDSVGQKEPEEGESSETPEDECPPAPTESNNEPPKAKSCSVADCRNAIFSRGMCSKHYQRERRKEKEAVA